MDLHHRPLAELSVRLSPHSAPIRQTHWSGQVASARINPRVPGPFVREATRTDLLCSEAFELSHRARSARLTHRSMGSSADAHHHGSLPAQLGVVLYILDPENILGTGCEIETFKALKNWEKRENDEYRTQRLILRDPDLQRFGVARPYRQCARSRIRRSLLTGRQGERS